MNIKCKKITVASDTNHKSCSISIRNVRSAADGAVHARLCEGRLIQLVVTPLTIADVVDDDVLTKPVSVCHGQLARLHYLLYTQCWPRRRSNHKKLQGGPIKTARFEIPYFCSHCRYNHAVFAEVFRNYSRKQQVKFF